MDVPLKRRPRWSLTPEAFDVLLLRLSDDPQQAGREFEQLHRYLTAIFQYAGGSDPGHLADMTLDRAAKRLAEGEQVDNLRAWLRGAARRVLQEDRTGAGRQFRAGAQFADRAEPPGAAQPEADHRILEHCLEALGPHSRELIERYYQHDGGSLPGARKRQARELGISTENLRTRSLRLRKVLEECFRRHRSAGEEPNERK